MTPKQKKSLIRYISAVGKEYGLTGWQMGLSFDAHDAVAAEVSCVYGRRIAHLAVSPDFLDFTPEEQRQVIVHEMTHIHLDQMQTLIHDLLPEVMGKPAFDAFIAGYRQAMEHATDAIADAIAPTFPLWEG